jgi:hypothetical protein
LPVTPAAGRQPVQADPFAWEVTEHEERLFWPPSTVMLDTTAWPARRTETAVRAHEMGIYKHYFDLIASGRKTTEIRVNDSSRKKTKKGSLIRFHGHAD